MKLLGAVLILCGAALHCITLFSLRRRQREALLQLSAAIEGLARELRVSLVPMPQLLARRGQGYYADAFFCTVLEKRQQRADAALPECWREAVQLLPLSKREQESLARPAAAFGGEEEDLLRALHTAAVELRASLSTLDRESAKSSRVIPALCFGSAILLTALLI